MVVRSRYLSPGYWRNEAMTSKFFYGEQGNGELQIFRTGDFAAVFQMARSCSKDARMTGSRFADTG